MSRKPSRLLPPALFAICLILVPVAAFAQGEDHAHGDHAGGDHGHAEGGADAEMAAMMALAQPGEHHAHLATYAGTWNTKTTMWQQPGAEPVTGSGTTVNTPILGGRYMQGEVTGNFMGMPFEGLSIEGYDNGTKRHIGFWIDSMGTMMMHFEGECSDDHKVVTTTSDFNMLGQRLKMKTITTAHDENRYSMEGWLGPDEAQMFKTMQIEYTRN